LEAALRTHLAVRPGSEDEVRPEERADTGSRNVSRLKIEIMVAHPEGSWLRRRDFITLVGCVARAQRANPRATGQSNEGAVFAIRPRSLLRPAR
jgi:hypothetical protein